MPRSPGNGAVAGFARHSANGAPARGLVYNRPMNKQQPDARRIGKGMTFAAWIIALVLMTLFFNNKLEQQRNPNQAVFTRVNAAGVQEIVLKRNRFGHYVTSGTVNGQNPPSFVPQNAPNEIRIHELCRGEPLVDALEDALGGLHTHVRSDQRLLDFSGDLSTHLALAAENRSQAPKNPIAAARLF